MARVKKAGWQTQKHSLEQRRDAVQGMMDLYREEADIALCRLLADFRDQAKELEVRQQEISEHVEAIGQLLADRWSAQGQNSVNVEGLGTFSIYPKLYVATADKTAYFQWLRDNGMEALIQPSVPPKTTESLVRERLEEGQPCEGMGLSITYKSTVR
jgi:hypothetical protein